MFVDGVAGVACFGLPMLAAFPVRGGALMAFAEARWAPSCLDDSPKSIVLRESVDDGVTWGPLRFLVNDSRANPGAGHDRDGLNLGSVAVVNGSAAYVHYVVCSHTCPRSSAMVVATTDGAATWQRPRNITAMASPLARQWVPGPGNGVVLTSGRIVVPGYYHVGPMFNGTEYGSTVLLSDDGGLAWRQGGAVQPRSTRAPRGATAYDGTGGSGGRHPPGCPYLEPNEAAVAELVMANPAGGAGAVLLEMRNRFQQAACNRRLTSLSTDQGETFTAPVESALPQPNTCHGATAGCGCEGSLVGHGGQQQRRRRRHQHQPQQRRLFFSGPSSTTGRVNGTVWGSEDGRLWEAVWQADPQHPGTPFGYSALALLGQPRETRPRRAAWPPPEVAGAGRVDARGQVLGLLYSTRPTNSTGRPSLRFVQIPA